VVHRQKHPVRDSSPPQGRALINVEISTSGMEIEGQHFLFAASRDIAERKIAEGVLKLNKSLLRRL